MNVIQELIGVADSEAVLATFALLLVGHALGDYALQTDFMVKAKNPRNGSIWPWVLGSHSLIHGFSVALILGNGLLGVAEAVAHFVIDFLKVKDVFGRGDKAFHIDQALHVGCKVLWLVLAIQFDSQPM